MEYRYWGPYSTEEIESQVNQGKFLILNKLFRDEKLTQEDYDRYAKDFGIIANTPSLFSKIWTKLLKRGSQVHFILVEQHSLKDLDQMKLVQEEEKE